MRPVLVAVCVLLIASVAFAQSDRGTVTGTISDQTNAVIPGASIVAANTENGTRFETISTETGNYTLTQLPAGSPVTFGFPALKASFTKYSYAVPWN